jgi:hypothetical protein
LKDVEKEVESSSDFEKAKEDEIEEVVTPPASSTTSRAGSHDSNAVQGDAKKIIRFRDGDPDNPDNWRQVRVVSPSKILALIKSRSRSYTLCS